MEDLLAQAAERCYKVLRRAPESCRCVFCEERFEGPGILDARHEHIGRHMEEARKSGEEPVAVDEWEIDAEMEDWLLDNEVLAKVKGRFVLASSV